MVAPVVVTCCPASQYLGERARARRVRREVGEGGEPRGAHEGKVHMKSIRSMMGVRDAARCR